MYERCVGWDLFGIRHGECVLACCLPVVFLYYVSRDVCDQFGSCILCSGQEVVSVAVCDADGPRSRRLHVKVPMREREARAKLES